MAETFEVDPRKDGKKQSIKRTLNRMIELEGVEKVEELMEEMRGYFIERKKADGLEIDEMIRALKRESKIKFYNEKHTVSKGRKPKVKYCFEEFKDFYEVGKPHWAAYQIHETRKALSRTSFWRFRKKVEEEYGFDPVEKFKNKEFIVNGQLVELKDRKS